MMLPAHSRNRIWTQPGTMVSPKNICQFQAVREAGVNQEGLGYKERSFSKSRIGTDNEIQRHWSHSNVQSLVTGHESTV